MKKYTLEELSQILEQNNDRLFDLKEIEDGTFRATCKICGGHPRLTRGDVMNCRNRIMKCAICSGLQIEQGINDIESQYPDIAKYFVDKEYTTTHSIGTHQKGVVECPLCHYQRLMLPIKIRERRFSCPLCGDGVSYPNKFARHMLMQLPVEQLEFEYSPDWMPSNHRYDNYFIYKNQKYILEMDGAQHFEDTEWTTLEWQKQNDEYKTKIAEDNGCKVIRVDCSKPYFENIKSNILNSELANIFDLSIINFEDCNRFATNSLIKEVSDFFMSNPTSPIYEIVNHFHIERSVIRGYLKRGASLGFCNYTPQESRRRSGYSISKSLSSRGKKMNIYDCDKNLIINCIGFAECCDRLNKLFPEKHFTIKGISTAVYRNKIYYKGLYFIPIKEGDDNINGCDSSLCFG